MNKFHYMLLLAVLTTSVSAAQSFEKYFTDSVLRVDYFFGGNNKSTTVFLDEMLKEPHWGGTKKLPKSADNAGNMRYNLYDAASGLLLYSRGFSTLFQEWQTIEEAKHLQRSMSMTATMPFPKNKVRFEIEEREYATGKFKHLFSIDINPANYFIRPELRRKCESRELRKSGAPPVNVDLVFIPEGYSEREKEKFYKDASLFADYFLSQAPFDKYKHKFNIHAVWAASEESGADIPGKRIYKNTLLNSSYYTFDMDRYLTTNDIKTISDLTANVPCDATFVLVNSNVYGGGGFYNWYAMGTSDHRASKVVAIHEFGHSFGGLADEYYTSSVAYSDFYCLDVEPWEANITTRVDFDSKWKNMIDKNTPIPTPRTDGYKDVVGLFEGGGYLSKGIFSPMVNCRMKGNDATGFCPVCQKQIERMIKYYCGED